MTDLLELRARVRAAEGPDAQLDNDILRAVLSNRHERDAVWSIDYLTGNIDSALSLVERVFDVKPHIDLRFVNMEYRSPGEYDCACRLMPLNGFAEGRSRYMPLAILDALLTALIEQAEKQDAAE